MTDLLPYNRSGLEAALSDVLGPRLLGDTGGGDLSVDLGIAGFKVHAIADAVVPWLVWEYGLDELMPYLADPRRAIIEGVAWQRLRGTTAALTTAMGWLGITPVVIEETTDPWRWWGLQIDPGRVLTPAEVRNLVGVATMSLPARSRLQRVYHGYDLRAARYDMPLGSALLVDDWSGIDVDGVRLSFSSRFAAPVPAVETPAPYWAVSACFGAVYHMRPGVRYDDNATDGAADDLPARPGFVVVSAWPSPDRGGRPPAFADRASLRAGAKDGMAWDDVGAVWDVPVHWRSTGAPPRYDLSPDAEPLVWRLDLLSTLRAPGFGDVVAVFPAVEPPVAGSVVSIGAGVGQPPFRYDAPIDGKPLPAAGMVLSSGELLAAPAVGWGVGPWTGQPWGVATADFMMAAL